MISEEPSQVIITPKDVEKFGHPNMSYPQAKFLCRNVHTRSVAGGLPENPYAG
jgi:hypothetical protein